MEIREDLGPVRRRGMMLLLAIFLVLGALHLRMAQLQLIEGAHWRRMAENNRLRRLPLAAVRPPTITNRIDAAPGLSQSGA